MIVVYTSPGCASCRKVKQWLKERNLPYIEKNIFTTLLNETEIRHLLMRSENGSEDIISKRSKIIQQNAIDLDDMTISELVHFIQENPSVLKRPIILNERNFQVGYDEEEIDAFVPQQLRSLPGCPATPAVRITPAAARSGKKPDKHLRMLVFFLKSKRSKGRIDDENLSRFVRRRRFRRRGVSFKTTRAGRNLRVLCATGIRWPTMIS